MLTVLILSIFLRIYIIWIGLGIKDPWTYRFFPNELSIFIIGALSHQILYPAYKIFLGEKKFDRFSVWVTYLLIFATLTYSFLPTPKIVSYLQNIFPFISKDFYKNVPIGDLIKIAVFYPVFALALPLIFNFQEKRPWDKWIGELSYPVYICHMLVTYLVVLTIDNIATKDGFGIFQACINVDKFLVGICSAIFSVIFSIFIIKFIAQPIEVIRNKYRDNF
jgi:peptidoglycan/LPS O-acetylase OafA/YrhL